MRNLDLEPGDKFAHFVIVRLLGQGGMGRVFEAEHEFTGRRVALKLILEHLVDEDMRARMIQEARALAELDHPNIVRLYDANNTDGTIWLAMEFLQGRTLRAFRNTSGPVPVAQALHLLIETCDGVAAAHDIHIIHRDLKPENVLLTDQQVTKVLDFGAAKVLRGEKSRTTAIGPGGKRRIIGTPEYMSPEHLKGDRVDDRTDTYALAVIGMELLWDHPFRNPDGTMPEVYEMVRRQFVDTPPHLRDVAPHVPGEVADLLYRGLAKHPGDRPSVAEMAGVLRAARLSFKAANPDADSAPWAKQWTGPGSWVSHGPAVSLPRHVPAPKEPSRSVVVSPQPAGGAAPPSNAVPVSAAPASPPVISGDSPRSHAQPVYARTQELPDSAVAPAVAGGRVSAATVDLRPQRSPVAETPGVAAPAVATPLPAPQALTVVPATVGPAQRASHPERVRARRTRVLVFLAMCSVAALVALVLAFRGSSRNEGPGEPATVGTGTGPAKLDPTRRPDEPPPEPSNTAGTSTSEPEPRPASTDAPVIPGSAAGAGGTARTAANSPPPAGTKSGGGGKSTASPKPAGGTGGLDLPFAARPAQK